jgi:hypothetical protein
VPSDRGTGLAALPPLPEVDGMKVLDCPDIRSVVRTLHLQPPGAPDEYEGGLKIVAPR